MRNRIFILLIMMVVVFVPTAGFSEGDSYVAFRGGSISPDESGFDSGTHVEGASGKYINDGFVAEGTLGQYSSEAEGSGWNPFLGNWIETDEVTVTYLAATLKGVMKPSDILELYAGVGMGYYMADLEVKIASSALGSDTATGDDNIVGYHAVVGLNVDLSERLFVGLEGKIIKADDASFSVEAYGIPIELEGDIGGNSLLATIGLRF